MNNDKDMYGITIKHVFRSFIKNYWFAVSQPTHQSLRYPICFLRVLSIFFNKFLHKTCVFRYLCGFRNGKQTILKHGITKSVNCDIV